MVTGDVKCVARHVDNTIIHGSGNLVTITTPTTTAIPWVEGMFCNNTYPTCSPSRQASQLDVKQRKKRRKSYDHSKFSKCNRKFK